MTATKRCPKCGQMLPVQSFGWRNAAHTTRQGWCRRCLSRAQAASKSRRGRDGREHLRNHYDVGQTVCGLNANSRIVASRFYDEAATANLPACAECTRIDEFACLEADAAQREPREPFDPNPYRPTYLAIVERLSTGKATA